MALSPALREAILNMPAATPPLGVVPNFVNPHHYGHLTNGLVSFFIVLITVSVSIRMFTKWRIVGKVNVEDIMLAVSFLVYTCALAPVILMAAHKGIAIHQWNMTVRDTLWQSYIYSIGTIVYALDVMFLKVSILLQCIRVFIPTGTRNLAFWVYHVLLWIHILFYITSISLEFAWCHPRAKLWDPTIIEGHCLGKISIRDLVSGGINAGSDCLLVILSQNVIWNLHVPARRKRIMSGVFLLGLIPTICSIVRIYYLVQGHRDVDRTFWYGMLGEWGMAELAFGIFAASAVVMPKFFKHLGKKPVVVKIRSWLPSVRQSSTDDEKSSRLSKRFRISLPGGDKRRAQVSDVEYNELVEKSLNLSMTSKSMVSRGEDKGSATAKVS